MKMGIKKFKKLENDALISCVNFKNKKCFKEKKIPQKFKEKIR